MDGAGEDRVETGERARRPFPWLWLAPNLALLAGLAVRGVLVYPRLPSRVPQHLGLHGADAFTAKSVGAVFGPLFAYAGAVVLFAASAVLVLRVRARSQLGPDERVSPLVNRPNTPAGALRVARATLFMGVCTGVAIAATCAVMWRTGPWRDPAPWVLPCGVLLPLAAGVAALLAVAVRDQANRGDRGRVPRG